MFGIYLYMYYITFTWVYIYICIVDTTNKLIIFNTHYVTNEANNITNNYNDDDNNGDANNEQEGGDDYDNDGEDYGELCFLINWQMRENKPSVCILAYSLQLPFIMLNINHLWSMN